MRFLHSRGNNLVKSSMATGTMRVLKEMDVWLLPLQPSCAQ